MTETLTPQSEISVSDPSILAGDTNISPADIREQVLVLLDTEDDEQFVTNSRAFISERLQLLESNSRPDTITYRNNPLVKGFIHPESVIHPEAYEGEEAPGFMVNDPEIYEVLMASLRQQKEALRQRGKELDGDGATYSFFINGVQGALIEYFGLDQDAEAKHTNMFMLDVGTDEQKMEYSLSELKGKAMCIEYAAAGNNMLNLVGIGDMNMALGRVQSEDSTDEGHHAFLIIKGSDGKQKIFDPIRPAFTYDYDKSVRRVRKPAIYPGAEEILNGGELAVVREDAVVKDGQRTVQEVPFTYFAR